MGGERGRGRAPAIPWGKEPEPVAKSGGMKLDVVPVAVVSNGSDGSARVTAKLRVDDSHTLSLEADDSSFRDGVSKKGMTVGFCKKDVDDKTSATLTYDLKSLSVAAKYQHNSDTSIERRTTWGPRASR